MKKILVVEDELAYLKLLEDRLKAEDYEVITAMDGKQGLESALKNRPDLIVLDIRMPVMDGMAMLDELRKQSEYGEKVIVILLTNLEPDGVIIKKVAVDQPTYYLIKSEVKLEELMAKIKEVFEKK